ncbi:hypothetical protein [Spiroplasma endosymbiont of Dilophus febrilis]|uniref:hypothetical protein n=1 Tax=Spiroplasma endosymbiont of Dilophus febrilis TaxID=3066292 RepID=UPI00313B4AA6
MNKNLLLQLSIISLLGSNLLAPLSDQYINSLKEQNNDQTIPEGVLFIPDIDGSSLQENEWTYVHGLKLFNNFIGSIESSAKVVLQNENLLSKSLTKGTNIFFVKIIVGNEVRLAVGRLINVRLSIEERISELIKHLEKTIDGSKLSKDISYEQVINFANLLANKQDNKIKISLNNSQDAKKMLNLGTNFLKVDVKINNVIKQKILSLKNVKDNNDLFFQEILTAFVKPKLVIDGKTLFVNDTYRDALQLIKNHIEKALPIAKISLEDVNQSFQQIKANRVQVRVVIRIANISQVAIFSIKNIVVRSQHSAWDNFVANAKNYSSDNYFLSQLFKQEENQDLINVNTVKEELDGSLIYGEGLTSANTIADAFNQWVDEFDVLYDEVKFSLDPSVDGTEKLQEDENTFVIKISSGKESATIIGGVTGVELLDEDRLNNFEKHLENPIDGSALNTGQTHSDALDFLIDKLSNFDNFVEITLTNLSVDGSKKLTVNSKINITIKSNDVKRKVAFSFLRYFLKKKK